MTKKPNDPSSKQPLPPQNTCSDDANGQEHLPEQGDSSPQQDRREFLANAASIGLAGSLAGSVPVGDTDPSQEQDDNPLFQPAEFWQERMEQPESSTNLGWFVDTRRCFGCHACEVSCKSENDVPLGNYIRQTFYQDVGEYPQVARLFLPMSCQHCEDAPCIKACPCGALHKKEGGTVAVDYDTCCGHGTCVDVCPYGAIYLDPVAKQAVKCHNCYHRTEHGLEPACVPTCPSEALFFGDLNDPDSKVSQAKAKAEAESGLVQLRPEQETKPRMWFAGDAPAEIEPRVPGQGESYHPGAYSIYNWKKKPTDGSDDDSD